MTDQSQVLYINQRMDTWKEFEANELTHSGAHHLLAIHEVGAMYGGWARVSDIARLLNITRGSVSINLRTLKKRGWVETDEHRLVRLSPKGRKVVHAVMAKRVIVKTFLCEVLGVPEPQAEIDSCKIEHLISHSTGERLVQFLQFLTSGAPVSRQLLKQFRAFHAVCPESRTCEVCNGQCLIDELKHAI
ncbi:MAG: metal-dependent transcriptional regulator [Acidobacteria bacterium]|nr:metal-dependent transcriptional regulator [Acidobacteriota bacterium]